MPLPPPLTIFYERDEDGWWVAQVPEVQGVVSQGRTREEAYAMVLDALDLAHLISGDLGEHGELPAFDGTKF